MTYTPASSLVARLKGAAADGLTTSAERVRGATLPRTPLEYGDLRSSLTVVPAEPRGATLESAVVSDLPYAVRQHEDMSYSHDDGEAKFLENATLASRRDVEQLMAAAASRRMGA